MSLYAGRAIEQPTARDALVRLAAVVDDTRHEVDKARHRTAVGSERIELAQWADELEHLSDQLMIATGQEWPG